MPCNTNNPEKKNYFSLVLVLLFLTFFLKAVGFSNLFKGNKGSSRGVLRFSFNAPGDNENTPDDYTFFTKRTMETCWILCTYREAMRNSIIRK